MDKDNDSLPEPLPDSSFFEMTPSRLGHMHKISRRIHDGIESKYPKGQAEHGGNLWEKSMFPEIMEEVVDLAVYLGTFEGQLERAMDIFLSLCRLAYNAGVDSAEITRLHNEFKILLRVEKNGR